jgi:hypothetical protein
MAVNCEATDLADILNTTKCKDTLTIWSKQLSAELQIYVFEEIRNRNYVDFGEFYTCIAEFNFVSVCHNISR